MSREVLLFLAVFVASAVEGVEAVTIVLAAGLTRGWRSALTGAGAALFVLTAIVAALGPALTALPIDALRLVVGGLLLVFGLQWLRKAILRASGYKPRHDEDAIYAEQQKWGPTMTVLDWNHYSGSHSAWYASDGIHMTGIGAIAFATYLHRELREKGGAYGAYAQAGVATATFYFGSYRDPNIVRTYDIFDAAIGWVTDGDIEAEALKEAILGACGDVDPLESPDIKGRREATNRATGFTRQARELFKQRLLQVSADDLRRVTRAYLLGAPAVQTTVAGADLIDAARKERPALFEVVAAI